MVEVAIGKAAADALHVKIGDEFDLHPSWRDDGLLVKATVVGIIQPTDPNEDYWGGESNRFVVNSSGYSTYPFFLDETSLIQGIGAAIPEMDISTETLAIVDRGRINSNNAQGVENRVNGLRAPWRSRSRAPAFKPSSRTRSRAFEASCSSRGCRCSR